MTLNLFCNPVAGAAVQYPRQNLWECCKYPLVSTYGRLCHDKETKMHLCKTRRRKATKANRNAKMTKRWVQRWPQTCSLPKTPRDEPVRKTPPKIGRKWVEHLPIDWGYWITLAKSCRSKHLKSKGLGRLLVLCFVMACTFGTQYMFPCYLNRLQLLRHLEVIDRSIGYSIFKCDFPPSLWLRTIY